MPASSPARLGRKPTEGELYVAHFLGSSGASRLISLAEAKPGTRADEAIPGAARGQSVDLLRPAGAPRSVAEVYRAAGRPLRRGARDQRRAATAGARPPGLPTAPASRQRRPALRARHRASWPRPMRRPRSVTRRRRGSPIVGPVFHGLFRTSARPRGGGAGGERAVDRADAGQPDAASRRSTPQQRRRRRRSAGREHARACSRIRRADARALFRGRV